LKGEKILIHGEIREQREKPLRKRRNYMGRRERKSFLRRRNWQESSGRKSERRNDRERRSKVREKKKRVRGGKNYPSQISKQCNRAGRRIRSPYHAKQGTVTAEGIGERKKKKERKAD